MIDTIITPAFRHVVLPFLVVFSILICLPGIVLLTTSGYYNDAMIKGQLMTTHLSVGHATFFVFCALLFWRLLTALMGLFH